MANRETRAAELLRIYNRDKCVQASVVVSESRPKNAPLHDEFDWNDKSAAHQHRLAQARRLIRVTPIKVSEAGVRQRLVHVPSVALDQPTAAITDREGSYKPISRVVADASDYEKAMGELMRILRSAELAVTELKKAAGGDVSLLPTLSDSLKVAKSTLKLMMKEAS